MFQSPFAWGAAATVVSDGNGYSGYEFQSPFAWGAAATRSRRCSECVRRLGFNPRSHGERPLRDLKKRYKGKVQFQSPFAWGAAATFRRNLRLSCIRIVSIPVRMGSGRYVAEIFAGKSDTIVSIPVRMGSGRYSEKQIVPLPSGRCFNPRSHGERPLLTRRDGRLSKNSSFNPRSHGERPLPALWLRFTNRNSRFNPRSHGERPLQSGREIRQPCGFPKPF